MSKFSQYIKVLKWMLNGRPFPPPHLIKQQMILRSMNRYGPRIMVETGTLHGDMVEAMKPYFKQLYSIEISPALARKAQDRFANEGNVTIIENDSAIALKSLVPEIHEPALFWLDGHYSGGNTGKGDKDTPIMEELATIFASKLPHIVLIDDARCFGTEKDYPSVKQLESYVRSMRPNSEIVIKNDCIQISPGNR